MKMGPKPLKIVEVLLLLAIASQPINADFSCDTATTSSPNAPPFPTIFSNSFSYQARVEVNILDKNYSMVVDEYLDFTGNMGALLAYRNGQRLQLIYSYTTGELFHLNLDDKTCMIKNISDDTSSFIFGPVNFPNSSSSAGGAISNPAKIFGSGAALRFADDIDDVYIGTGLVRGIPVNIWTTCMAWPTVKGTMKVTYYFSQPNWNVSSPLTQVPVRIEIEGLSTVATFGAPSGPTLSPASPRYFHHYYDFINYLPTVTEDYSVFETPPGIICSSRISTRPLPQFNSLFTYRAEIVDPYSSQITHYAVWYDEDARLVREDKRTPNTDEQGNPSSAVSEIHDFKTGIRYVKNKLGGCTISPIDITGSDSQEDTKRFQYNGSLVVDIKDPNRFFRFNDNYKYVGQRTVRGTTCDVFSAVIPNFPIDYNVVNATFEYYFLKPSWHDIPLDGVKDNVMNYPIQLVISAPSIPFSRIYNFYDFAETFRLNEVFDVSQCFPYSDSLSFRLTFPGYYSPTLEAIWQNNVYIALAINMKVNPLRISGVTVHGQDFNVYVNAKIVGTANLAQFEKLPTDALGHLDDKVFKGVPMPDQCADLCIYNSDFVCEGFQLCSDDGFACRLLRSHVPNSPVLSNATACVEFSRTVKGPVQQETLIKDAYANLQSAVSSGLMQVEISNPSTSDAVLFSAINVQVLSGQALKSKTLPLIPTQFSYKLETVIPAEVKVVESFVWYDSLMNLVRYDTRDPDNDDPFTTTYIHDFSNGVAYQIDQLTQHCTISPIQSGGFDVVTGKPTTDGSLIVSMKSPQSIFYLDSSYVYVGERTVRGILCDVFESQRQDFQQLAYNLTQNSVFKYYFQSADWDYVSPMGFDITRSQPVMLEIEDTTTGAYMTINFYDFVDEHYTANYFDTSSCYEPEQRHSFMIIFKDQPYHPILDQASNSFINSALLALQDMTFASPLKFQKACLTYDDYNVYLMVTALGKVPSFALFTPVMSVAHNTSAPQVYADTPQDCAATCMSTSSFICNSFDWCLDPVSSQCLVGQRHKESEGDPISSKSDKPCTHYSRTENLTVPMVDINTLYKIITDNVYDNQLQITISLPGNLSKTYVATDIRDDLFSPNTPDNSAGAIIRKFVLTPRNQLLDSLINVTHSMVSVTDCAIKCLQENTFSCQSFDYKFTTGRCRLSTTHPDVLVNGQQPFNGSVDTNVYARMYTDEYTKYQMTVFTETADKVIPSINSDEVCARTCTENSDFRCESFDSCTDGSCYLRKLHRFDVSPTSGPQSVTCNHYSRNHLYDYVMREHKTLQITFDSKADASKVDQCAELCSTGVGLMACAAFAYCDVDRGDKQCSFTTFDPTVSRNATIIDSLACSLYTRVYPLANVGTTVAGPTGIVSSSVSVTNPSSTASTTTTTTKTASPSSSASTSSTSSIFASSTACVGASTDNSSDTGARVGIAFGTLFLGLIVGAVSVLLFLRHRNNNPGMEDVQMQRFNN